MQPTGVFISFEGIDGAGKSSHIQAVADAFRRQGNTVVQTREPGGTALAEKLRDMVLHDAMDPLCEALLVFAARRDHLQQVIEQQQQLVAEINTLNNQVATKRELAIKLQGVIEYLQQTGVVLPTVEEPEIQEEPEES